MFHEPSAASGPDFGADYKSKLGALMFVIYGVIYAVFVIINVVLPKAMEKVLFWGLNLAEVYGFGLIVFALLLAIVYNHMCSKKEAELADASSAEPTQSADAEV